MATRELQSTRPWSQVDLEEMADHADEAASLMRTLGNSHRLMILCVLSEGESSVGALNERVLLSQSALSQHLSILRRDGLVETRREQQTIYYRLAEGPAVHVIETLHELYCAPSASTTRKSQ